MLCPHASTIKQTSSLTAMVLGLLLASPAPAKSQRPRSTHHGVVRQLTNLAVWVGGHHQQWRAHRLQRKLLILSATQRRGSMGHLVIRKSLRWPEDVQRDALHQLSRQINRLSRGTMWLAQHPGFANSKVGQKLSQRIGVLVQHFTQLQLITKATQKERTSPVVMGHGSTLGSPNERALLGFWASKVRLVQATNKLKTPDVP